MPTGNKAKVNQPASVARVIGRLHRVDASIAQLEEQLKTPFRSADSREQAAAKLAALKGERSTLATQVDGMQKALAEALKPATSGSAEADDPETVAEQA